MQLRTKFRNEREALESSYAKGIGVLGGAASGHSWQQFLTCDYYKIIWHFL